MTSQRWSIELKTDLSEIGRMSEWIEKFGARHDLAADMVFQLNLALEEIVTNVISYAFDDDEEHEVEVDLSVNGNALEAVVKDAGEAYDPTDAGPPDLEAPVEDRPVGGLGVHLVKEMMDEVSYSRVGDKNVLSLKKLLPHG
jgi:anti-sigma regulatory factor (Ser/Thr protein kinase)